MDRKQEYEALLNELETPNLREKDSLRRAISRRRREQWLWRPTIGVVAACLSFVILVNFNAGVAEACSVGADAVVVVVSLEADLGVQRAGQNCKTRRV